MLLPLQLPIQLLITNFHRHYFIAEIVYSADDGQLSHILVGQFGLPCT
jgi:hypothetical protein